MIDWRKRTLTRGMILALFLAFSLASTTAAWASGHGKDKAAQKGVLLVTFGTSIPKAQKAFDLIDAAAKARFSGLEIRWAYTAKMIRRKLAKEGKITLSPSQALARMAEEGFGRIVVQSLHVIPGLEFHDLQMTAKRFEGLSEGPDRVVMGLPLLSSPEDMARVAEAVLANLPPERKPDEAVVLMGHGTHHPANAVYPAMAYIFGRRDPNVLLGTVEGYPGVEQVLEDLQKRGLKKAWLMPFMSVAGDHALNDLAGDEPDSWKSILTKAGIECRPALKSLADFPKVVEVWLDHLAEALKELDQGGNR